MNPVEVYISKRPKNQMEIMGYLHELILFTIPEVKFAIKWQIPLYRINKMAFYMNPLKTGGIEFAFLQAKSFDNKLKSQLDFKNRSMVGGITIASLESIDEKLINALIKEAHRVDSK